MGRNDEDLALVRRCISSEPRAWQRFVDRFAPTLRALGRRYLKLHGYLPDEAELDDITQEVFLALTRRDFRLLRNYDPTFTVKTYLGVITRTEVHRILRRKRLPMSPAAELERAAAQDADAPQEAERAEEREVLLEALDALPERDAEILRLRFFRELDYRAISVQLAIPEPSVGQTLFRAKRKLLEKLRSILGILV